MERLRTRTSGTTPKAGRTISDLGNTLMTADWNIWRTRTTGLLREGSTPGIKNGETSVPSTPLTKNLDTTTGTGIIIITTGGRRRKRRGRREGRRGSKGPNRIRALIYLNLYRPQGWGLPAPMAATLRQRGRWQNRQRPHLLPFPQFPSYSPLPRGWKTGNNGFPLPCIWLLLLEFVVRI